MSIPTTKQTLQHETKLQQQQRKKGGADKIYKQACKLKIQGEGEWDDIEVKKIASGLDEEKAGMALFQWIGACRINGIDPESALRKFACVQVKKLEAQVQSQG